jgi:hypothetical protein
MDEAKLESLLGEATVQCYDQEEEFWGVFCALISRVSFPLQANVAGETVDVVGLDEPSSGLDQGVMTRVSKGGQEQKMALSELDIVDPDAASAEWLAVYKHWLKKVGRG